MNNKLKDFRNFLYLVWKHLRLPEPTPIQYDLAHYLATGSSRTIISAYRGCGKSWITSAYVLWRLLLNPQLGQNLYAFNLLFFTSLCIDC